MEQSSLESTHQSLCTLKKLEYACVYKNPHFVIKIPHNNIDDQSCHSIVANTTYLKLSINDGYQ